MITETKEKIAKRAAQELEEGQIINLGIGIPTLIPKYTNKKKVFLHTENGMLGLEEVEKKDIDPNLINAGKQPVGEVLGTSFFNSSDSFGMIRGGHIDVAILGVLQIDKQGKIANWSIPGKNIMGVGGAMDLLSGAEKIIITTTHTTKEGKSKILDSCTYPITSTRSVDIIVTDLAVFKCIDKKLHLTELMPNVTLQEVIDNTEAYFINSLNSSY